MLNRVTKQSNPLSLPDSVRKLPQGSRIGLVFNTGALQAAYEGVVSAMRRGHDGSLEELQGAVEYLLDTVITAKRARATQGMRVSQVARARPS